jgi:hypothetical protein
MSGEMNKTPKETFYQLYRGYLSDGKNVENLYNLLNKNRGLLKTLSRKEAYNITVMLLDKANKDLKKLNSELSVEHYFHTQ